MLEQLGFDIEDHGNLAVEAASAADGPTPNNAKYYDEIKTWIRSLSERAFLLARSGAIPLFMGGDRDFNVPIAGGEQMYTALRTLGVPTQLVVYPDQHHELGRPSFYKDRLERTAAWFDHTVEWKLSSSVRCSPPAVSSWSGPSPCRRPLPPAT